MDITPLIPKGKKLINSYGGDGFTVSGDTYNGNILVTPNQVKIIAYDFYLEAESVNKILTGLDDIEVLLIGLNQDKIDYKKLRATLKPLHLNVEIMQLGPACRTYNVLLCEGRDVSALLLTRSVQLPDKKGET